jgi:hypothetical protein
MITGGHRLLINGVWEFVEGPDGEPPVAGWQAVRVPHRSREFEQAPPASGWYRTELMVPARWTDAEQRIVLDLERVRHYGRVYLDGQAVDAHYHMRLPWRLDLSNRVRPGESYELMVYTHNCTGTYAHPQVESLSEAAEQALDTLFWRTSIATVGIEGDVWLCLEPLIRLEDPYVVTSVRDKTITVEASVRNDSDVAFAGQVDWCVRREGRTKLELATVAVRVEAGAAETVRVAASWDNAVLWGRPPYGEPVLYNLQASLGADKPVHRLVERFGFREVWAEGDRLLLNGEKLMPWGDHTVPYVYERQWLTRKLNDWGKANISILEHHRYDPPEVFYEVADELGAFVVGANFCVGTGQVPPPELDAREMQLVMDSHLAVADAWLRRTRNHPAILFWDITDAREPAFCVPLLRQVKKLDPTRIAEVTFDPSVADAELIELIDCYRLFSSLEQIEATIERIHTDPALPLKPIRVGEAGIFTGGTWDADAEPPLAAGWWDFLTRIPERNIHGLQTFFLADMDYRVFETSVPGSLVAPVHPKIYWPSASGRDARIDPFGKGTQEAWGKATLYVNWSDPDEPVSRPTRTYEWSQELYRRWTGRDVGPLAAERVPEVMVSVERQAAPVAGAQVFVEALTGQGMISFGIQADTAGTSWFVLPEPGAYRFSCAGLAVDVDARCSPLEAPAGYEHVQQVRLVLPT